MRLEHYNAEINSLAQEIRERVKDSGTREKHINYFLNGIREEADKLSKASGRVKRNSRIARFGLGKVMHKAIRHSFADASLHPKALEENMGRLLQALYLEQEQIDSYEGKVQNGKIGAVYDNKKTGTLVNDPKKKKEFQ